MTHRRRRGVRPLAALAVLAITAAACGTSAADRTTATPSSSGTTSSTSSTATPATTTTTTTTLPSPVRLQGTGRTGAGTSPGGAPGPTASYGPVERILVQPLAAGASTPPPTTTSLPDPPGAVAVAYHELGSGPDLVLVPGEHASMTSWDPAVVQALEQHYTVVLFDPPSVGYSAPDPAVRSVQAMADVVGGLITALGLTEPAVLGWGMGGQVALALAERHPGVVGKLVLVDTTAGGPTAPRPSPAVSALLASPSATTAELVGLELASPSARAALLERMAAYAPDDLTTAGIRQEAAVEAASLRDPTVAAGLGRIRIPALVVTGGQDVVMPPAAGRALATALHRARALYLADAGYGVLTEDETRVVDAIEAFTG